MNNAMASVSTCRTLTPGLGAGPLAARPKSIPTVAAAAPLDGRLCGHARPAGGVAPLGVGLRLGASVVSQRTTKNVSIGQQQCGPRRTTVTMGLPIPVIGFLFTPFTVALAYFAIAVKFWFNYQKTVYSQAMMTKLTLTALWPVLFVINDTYRTNFKKAW